MLLLFLVSTVTAAIQPFINVASYKLNDQARNILPKQNPKFAEVLKYDAKKLTYEYNQGYDPKQSGDLQSDSASTPRITASFNADPSKGFSVTDPVNQTDFGMKPKFALGSPRQDGNQLLYPLSDTPGFLVYTGQTSGVKEDILLSEEGENGVSYKYELIVGDGQQARLEKNGSIGVYGSELLANGNISTGTDQDKQLLDKARKNGQKTKLLFTIPAPVVSETNKTVSQVKAHFELDGNTVTVVAENLKGASYPLSIDPSVYIETAQKLMRGNAETNVDFDINNGLIEKGKLSGGRFNAWNNTTALPATRWGHATTVAGGYVYVVGGMDSSNVRSGAVYWAHFNDTTGAIEAPNPGSGACASWCTDSAYNLPVPLTAHAIVAYNGFLYIFGGETTSGTKVDTVYIAKIGANGEPSLWHPTDTDPANWVYWYSDTALATATSYTSAAAYNNRMYVMGGRTAAAPGGVTTVQKADISPLGILTGWTSTGMQALTSVRHMHNVLSYNGYLYVLGGNSAGIVQSSVQYIKLNTDGTMAGSWVTTTAMGSARLSQGGNFATIWGGYIYVAGGCSAVAGTGDWCSVTGLSNARDIQLASINADGSITDWNSIIGITSSRMGYGFVAWRQTVYGIGGCTAQDTATNGNCTTLSSTYNYGAINPDGDVSTVSDSVASGTAPCAAATWTQCDLPPAGNAAGQGGRMSEGVAINNGYIYIFGGCTDISSTTAECNVGGTGRMSSNTSYSALAVDGSLVRPAACAGTFSGSWCVDSTNTLNGANGLGTMSVTVFNNVVYAIGGTDGTNWSANVYRNTLNDNGSLAGAWASQTFTTVGLGTARGYAYSFSRANPSAAATNPGNLYVFGGCNNGTTSDGLGCGTYFTNVYKCSIQTAGTLTGCTTTGQLQIDSESQTAGAQGLGLMAGVLYANYVYLIGGSSINESERGEVMYAALDDSNNIVAVSGGIWQVSPNQLSPVRRRGFAFGYNGYLYSLAGYTGTGSLNDLLYAKIDVSNGSISAFTTSFVTVNPRWDLKAIVANGYVYAIGGCSAGSAPVGCTAMTGGVQTFQLYNNYSGSPAAFSTTTNTGVDRIGGSATVLNGYIYYAGGCSAVACTTGTAVNNVYYAPLNADGTIGTWTAAANNLPAVRSWGKLVASGGTLYYLGGQDGAATPAAQTTVYYSTPASGVPAAWATASNGLLAARTEIGAAVWNNRIYVTGGYSGSARQSTVYMSPTLATGGDITSVWTSTGAFNVARSGHVTIAYANNLYILGGWDGTQYLNDVQLAKINANGTVTGWGYTTSLPQRVFGGDGFAANGYMYVFGGRSAAASATTCTNNTYITPISANTTIASGNNPTGIGDWSQTNVEFSDGRFGIAAVYDQGKAYVLGGGCTAFVAAGNRGYLTALQAQPMVAKYSRMIDTDTDVFPSKWLMNGLDNDVGAHWQLRYRSSTATNAAWGQDTNYGTVTLGTPDNYIPVDGSGTNTSFARYFYMFISIDSSQAFGYPEDITRGPTLDDITLFYTADPSKRMRFGKTFTGGLLQPFDTPF